MPFFSGLDPCPFKFWLHPWKVSESLFIKQSRPTLNKHGTSVPLNLFQTNMKPQFLWSCLTNKTMSSDKSRTFVREKFADFSRWVVSVSRFLNATLKSILMFLYYLYHHLFFLLGSPLSIWEGVFLKKWIVDFSR